MTGFLPNTRSFLPNKIILGTTEVQAFTPVIIGAVTPDPRYGPPPKLESTNLTYANKYVQDVTTWKFKDQDDLDTIMSDICLKLYHAYCEFCIYGEEEDDIKEDYKSIYNFLLQYIGKWTPEAALNQSLASLWDDVEQLNRQELNQILMEFSYAGFDALRVRGIALNRASYKDILSVCLLYISRGTNQTKMSTKMSKEGIARMNRVVTSLGLGKAGLGSGPEVLSIARIAAAFPEIVALCLKKTGAYKLYGYTGTTPGYLCFPQAPSLMTDRADYEEWKNWSRRFTHVISGKKLETFGTEIVPFNETYSDLAFSSTLFSFTSRADILDKLK